MSIRLAVPADYRTILELAIKFHEEAVYSKYDFNQEKVLEFCHESLNNPKDFLLLVAECKDKIVGFFFAVSTTLPLYNTTTTFELAWYVLPEHRASRLGINLFKSYEWWSKEIAKADLCQAGTSEILDLSKLYKRMGYTSVEKSFLKEHK